MKRDIQKRIPIVAIDFDDTCCVDKYPYVGEEIEGASDTIKYISSLGYRLVLWTCREHIDYQGQDPLQNALDWFVSKGISLYAINNDPDIENYGYIPSRKIHADYLIDDKAIGIPKKNGIINWKAIRHFFRLLNLH